VLLIVLLVVRAGSTVAVIHCVHARRLTSLVALASLVVVGATF
jgi:hypothetical protein